MGKPRQAKLRVVDLSGDVREPRRYAQSTSGRMDSHETTPPDSRSILIASDSRNGCATDIALRKYPTVVPQRSANESCDSRSSEFKYRRSASMSLILLNGKSSSILDGNLPFGNRGYDAEMAKRLTRQELKEIRFRNFDALLDRYDGSPKKFCEKTGYTSETTISQLKTRKKAFGTDLGRQIAEAAGLDPLALENPDGIDASPVPKPKPPRDWPFSFSYAEYMSLSPRKRREMDEAFRDMVIGAQTQQMVARKNKQA